jgi:hypothetical protein
MNIATLDLIIIAVYLVGITATATGSTMLASNIFTIHLVMGNYKWVSSFCLLALALFVLLCVLYLSLL